MTLPNLIAEIDIPAKLVAEIAELIQLKSVTNELGDGPRRAAIDAFAREQLAWGERMLADLPQDARTNKASIDALFRNMIGAAT